MTIGLWEYTDLLHNTTMALIRIDAHKCINSHKYKGKLTLKEIEKKLIDYRLDLYMSKAYDILERNNVKYE